MQVAQQAFFSKEQVAQIKAAIEGAERNTSGEIKVHIEKKCEASVLDRAAEVFNKLGMQRTRLRNGVLIYLAYEHRKFAILGDTGINAVVPDNFWDDIKVIMQHRFRGGSFIEGLVEGIRQSGEQLRRHFPYDGAIDENELTDDVSIEGQ